MNTKHTPGPWTVKPHDLLGYPIVTVKHPSADGPTSTGDIVLANPGPHSNPEEREANARLIASAPDLLEALNRILERPDVNMQFGDDEVFARKAIAKATHP